MAARIRKSIWSHNLLLGVTLALAPPALAGDVTVKLDSGAAFSVRKSTNAERMRVDDATGNVSMSLGSGAGFLVNSGAGLERLRVDEATGNISRNGGLFVHTTGTLSVYVGDFAGNTSTSGSGRNVAFGRSVLSSNTTGSNNATFGFSTLRYNTTGSFNSAFGIIALRGNSTGTNNAAVGYNALGSNTAGSYNTAVGAVALMHNVSGYYNSAFGHGSLYHNTSGLANSAVGLNALFYNTTGDYNSAVGSGALKNNTGGNRNVAVGRDAGRNQTTGNDNIYLANTGVAAETGRIRIGTSPTHTATFVAGIRGVTTANANAVPVLIDSAGQLGTVSSSRSVKKEIRDMGDATARLLELRPVMFRYTQEQTLPGGGEVPPEYGLIAEEVAEIYPDLVVYDDEGRPFTVKYHEMAPMLLNEMKKQQHTIEAQRQESQAQQAEIQALRLEHQREMAALTARLAQLETRD